MLFMAFQAADPQSARAYTTLTNLHLSIRPRHSLLPVVRGPGWEQNIDPELRVLGVSVANQIPLGPLPHLCTLFLMNYFLFLDSMLDGAGFSGL
ncbi:MAG: hypothetical protein QOH78_250 [Verrucomicrobiota bacterium]